MQWLGSLFGYLLYGCYKIMFSNFGLAVILFTILTRLLMFPITINQQKSTAKMQRLQPRVKEIQDRYKNDKDRMNNELMALYQKENYNPSSGCLPMLIQMPIFFGLYFALRAPLTFTFHYNEGHISSLVNKLFNGAMDKDYYKEIYLIEKIRSFELPNSIDEITTRLYLEFSGKVGSIIETISGTDISAVSGSDIAANSIASAAGSMAYSDTTALNSAAELAPTVQKINEVSRGFRFLGLDLLATPEQDKLNLIIVALVFITSVGSMLLTNKINGTKNTAQAGGCNPMTMGIGMAIFSSFISYSVPAALGFYWMLGSLISPLQAWIVQKFFNTNILNSKAEAQRVARLRIDEGAIIEETQRRKGVRTFMPIEPSANEKQIIEKDNSSSKNKKKKNNNNSKSSSDYQGKKKN